MVIYHSILDALVLQVDSSGPFMGRFIFFTGSSLYIYISQNSGMDRPAMIQTYGSVWITSILVWIRGMDRPVGSGYGSGWTMRGPQDSVQLIYN